MWWDEFKRRITNSFNTYNPLDKRSFHSNDMRLRIFNGRILAVFLQSTKASINLELSKTPVTITYGNLLAALRNQVNHKFPPELSSSNNRKTRKIKEAGICCNGRGGIFQGGGGRYQGLGGRGRSVRRGRGRYGRGHVEIGNHRHSRKYA